MADITISDVTYTIQEQGGRLVHRVSAIQKSTYVKVEFGDGVLTYPAGGVPLSITPVDVGFLRAIFRWIIVDGAAGSGIMWKYDFEAKTLRGYRTAGFTPAGTVASHVHQQQITTGSTVAADATSGALIEDSAAVETVFRAMGVPIDTTLDIGNTLATAPVFTGTPVVAGDLVELVAATDAPVAQRLYMQIYGW